MKKVLFIASLNTKKQRFDGERIKSTFMYEAMKKVCDLSVINLSVHKLFNSFRILWYGIFFKKKIDKLIISKDPHGANIIMKILRFAKFPLTKITYFEIGPFLYDRILQGNIKKETFFGIDIVVETKSMKEELSSLGFSQLSIYPNFKPIYDISKVNKEYPSNTLSLVYFSRISEQKGIYELIEALKILNKDSTKYTLDIFGRLETKEDEDKILSISKELPFTQYKGKLDIQSSTDYQELANYDLHVFPTKYAEGFPGSIIDFFIAGVPTLSSTFARANDILSEKDSILFEKGNTNDLVSKLNSIYENQTILHKLREGSFARREEFSLDKFEEYINGFIND